MTAPDVRPGSVTQIANASFDGTNACDRVGVEVQRSSPTVFAAALGVNGVTIGAASVGRAIEKGESKDVIAALNILEPSKCGALKTSGQGSVQVNGVDDQAGFIAVESDGRSGGSPAATGRAPPSRPRRTTLNFIRADGSLGPGHRPHPGLCTQRGARPATRRRPTTAGPSSPRPRCSTERYGATPVTDIFNCTAASCAPGGDDWVDQLEAMYGGSGMPTEVWPSSAVDRRLQDPHERGCPRLHVQRQREYATDRGPGRQLVRRLPVRLEGGRSGGISRWPRRHQRARRAGEQHRLPRRQRAGRPEPPQPARPRTPRSTRTRRRPRRPGTPFSSSALAGSTRSPRHSSTCRGPSPTSATATRTSRAAAARCS